MGPLPCLPGVPLPHLRWASGLSAGRTKREAEGAATIGCYLNTDCVVRATLSDRVSAGSPDDED